MQLARMPVCHADSLCFEHLARAETEAWSWVYMERELHRLTSRAAEIDMPIPGREETSREVNLTKECYTSKASIDGFAHLIQPPNCV